MPRGQARTRFGEPRTTTAVSCCGARVRCLSSSRGPVSLTTRARLRRAASRHRPGILPPASRRTAPPRTALPLTASRRTAAERAAAPCLVVLTSARTVARLLPTPAGCTGPPVPRTGTEADLVRLGIRSAVYPGGPVGRPGLRVLRRRASRAASRDMAARPRPAGLQGPVRLQGFPRLPVSRELRRCARARALPVRLVQQGSARMVRQGPARMVRQGPARMVRQGSARMVRQGRARMAPTAGGV
jgi:hypothetical protein